MKDSEMLTSLPDLEKKLIIEFIAYTSEQGLSDVSHSELINISKSIDIHPALIENAIRLLRDRSMLARFSVRGINRYKIHSSFHQEAVPYYSAFLGARNGQDRNVNQLKEELFSTTQVPASDRFVSLDDNQPHLVEARKSLELLSSAIRESNSLIANSDDRFQISREIDHLSEVISKPRIHVLAVWDAVYSNKVLRWLSEQAVSGIVRQAAVEACKQLAALLSHLKSFF